MRPVEAKKTFEQLLDNVPNDRVQESHDYWARRTLKDVRREMPDIARYGFADIAIVDPEKDVDETRTLVLPLEFTQGLTPQHYIRAKVLQQYIAPKSRVIVMPNSTYGARHVDLNGALTREQMRQFVRGDYMPYGQVLTGCLEQADMKYGFGELSLVGSSQAGKSVLAIAASGSDIISVENVTAIETPSKNDREVGALAMDLMKSGGNLAASIRGSEIPAQQEAVRGMRIHAGLAKFMLRPIVSKETRSIARALAGSVNGMLELALPQLPPGRINLYYVEGSTLFDPASLSDKTRRRVQIAQLIGKDLHGHSTSNNLRFNAAIAYDGLHSWQ